MDASAVIMPGEEYTYRLYLSSNQARSQATRNRLPSRPKPFRPRPQLSASRRLWKDKPSYGSIPMTWSRGLRYGARNRARYGRRSVRRAGIPIRTDYSAHTDTAYRYRVRAIRGENVYSDFAVSDLVNNADPSIPGQPLFPIPL